MRRCAITTIDNPFNPFKEWDKWYQYDISKGYGTVNYVARLFIDRDDLSDEENSRNFEHAIDIIVTQDCLGIYRKVVEEDENT